MRKRTMISLLVCLLFFPFSGMAQNTISKINLKVLFVGHDPTTEMPKTSNFRDWNTEQFKKDFKTRMPAFKNLLEKNFTYVKCIDKNAYKEAMSAHYDVTIFDEIPPAIKKAVREKDKNGNITRYEPEAYLSENYDHATIFLGKIAPDMGKALGSKLDWM